MKGLAPRLAPPKSAHFGSRIGAELRFERLAGTKNRGAVTDRCDGCCLAAPRAGHTTVTDARLAAVRVSLRCGPAHRLIHSLSSATVGIYGLGAGGGRLPLCCSDTSHSK